MVGADPGRTWSTTTGDALIEKIDQPSRRRLVLVASLAVVAVDESTLQLDTYRRLSRGPRTD